MRAILADQDQPCLILVDLLSGGMNGSDFLALRRTDDILMEIPVVVMSSIAAGPGETARVDSKGASDYLKKPFDTDVLIDRVRQFCDAV